MPYKNKGEQAANHDEWQKSHSERTREYAARYYERNKDRILAKRHRASQRTKKDFSRREAAVGKQLKKIDASTLTHDQKTLLDAALQGYGNNKDLTRLKVPNSDGFLLLSERERIAKKLREGI